MEGNLEEGLDCKRDPGCSTSGQGELQELVSASSSSSELVGSFPREAFAAPGVGFSCSHPRLLVPPPELALQHRYRL